LILDGNSSEKLSAQLDFHKIGPWLLSVAAVVGGGLVAGVVAAGFVAAVCGRSLRREGSGVSSFCDSASGTSLRSALSVDEDWGRFDESVLARILRKNL
jgi:hypothetical protein